MDRAMQDGATIQLPMRPWVDEVPEPVTPMGSQPYGESAAVAPPRNSEAVPVAGLPSPDSLQGRVVANRYLVEELLDETEAGLLYRAYHLGLDQPVIVQILPRGLACSEERCQEVLRAASSACTAAPDKLVNVLDFGVLNDGWPYVVSDKLEGKLLSAVLGTSEKFVLRRVLHMGKQIAASLTALHESGVIHGHLRPEFVQVTNPGTPAEVAKLGGVGLLLARGEGAQPPKRGALGTPHYVSPEQAGSNAPDGRSDVYALGILLYRMMAGQLPFHDGDFDDILCQHLDDEPPSPSAGLSSPGALAKALDAIILRCLRKDPAARYQHVAELSADLSRLEAAATRSKRRPMAEIAKPQSTIHTPAARSEGPRAEAAKVIVGRPIPKQDPAAPTQVRASLAPVAPRKVSRFQETVRISARDVELALARRRGGWPKLRVELQVTWEKISQWVGGWVVRLKAQLLQRKVDAAPEAEVAAKEPNQP